MWSALVCVAAHTSAGALAGNLAPSSGDRAMTSVPSPLLT